MIPNVMKRTNRRDFILVAIVADGLVVPGAS